MARDDSADVAVEVLAGEGHDGQTYDLTGPEARTLAEAAELLSQATGRTIVYVPETIEEAYESRASFGAPRHEVDGWVTSYLAIATGEMDVVSDAVERIAGHRPQTIADFLGVRAA